MKAEGRPREDTVRRPGEETVRRPSEEAVRELAAFWARSMKFARLAVMAVGVALCFAPTGAKALVLGWLLGGSCSMLRFRLRYRALLRGAAGAMVRSRLLAYALSALALAPAFAFPRVVSPWSTVPGLFVMNAAVVLSAVLEARNDGGRRAHKPAEAES